jgi:hypothetical protein
MMFGKKTIYSDDTSAPLWDKRPENDFLIYLRDFGKYFVIWGGNYFASALGDCPSPLIWDKQTGKNTYADGEMAFSNVAGTMRIFRHQWCGAFKDSERGEKAVHPTQKPVQLMQWCIDKIPDDGGYILDPFMGSGTTGVACVNLKRRFVGIEIDPDYFDIALSRLATSQAQGQFDFGGDNA